MNIKFYPSIPAGTINAPPSKSHVERLLIASALADKPSIIHFSETCDDVSAMINSLRSLGADISKYDEGYRITPIHNVPDNVCLDCGEAGAVLRFLLPVASSFGIPISFIMHGKLAQRPHDILLSCLTEHGVSVTGTNPLQLSGQFKGGVCEIDASLSSQYASGILMSAPLLHEKTTLKLTGVPVSKPYLDLTLAVLRQFSINISCDNTIYTVSPQKYISPGNLTVYGDWSNAAFLLSAGAFSRQKVTVAGLKAIPELGDSRILSVLTSFGAQIHINDSVVSVQRGHTKAFEADAVDCPDLVPVLAILGAAAEGTTIIHHVQRLRLKESDRLESLTNLICRLGGDASIDHDDLTIVGHGSLSGGVVSSYGDHRVVMAAGLASIICQSPVTVTDAECVCKSWPGFFTACKELGIHMEETVS